MILEVTIEPTACKRKRVRSYAQLSHYKKSVTFRQNSKEFEL